MLTKKGLIIVFLILAVLLSLFSLNAVFFPNSGIFGEKGESIYTPTNNVELTILPPENSNSISTINEGGENGN